MDVELIFRGALLPGVERRDAVAALAARFKQAPEAVERRLFAGKPVRVKTVATEAEAERWERAFAQAGAQLERRPVEAPGDGARPQEPAQPPAQPRAQPKAPNQPQAPSSQKPPVRQQAPAAPSAAARDTAAPAPRRRSAGRRLVTAAGVLLLGLGGATAWYTYPLWGNGDTSDMQRAASNALATEQLVALAHLDVARAATLQQRLLGEPDPDALLSPDNELMNGLVQAGIDPRRQIDDALVAFYSDGEQASYAGVILGELDAGAVRAWLESRYQVDRFDAATGTVYFSWLEERTCQPGPQQAVRTSASRLLVAQADQIDALWQRLESGATSTRPIDEWLRLTESQLLTLGIFRPTALGDAADGMPGMMLSGAGKAAEPASAVYFGAAPSLMPPGVVLAGTVESDDQAFITGTHKAADTWLEETRAAAASEFPDVLEIYDRLAVSATDRTVSASLRLDTDFDDELQKLVSSAFQRAFRMTPKPVGGNQAVTERIDENPTQFSNVSAGQIHPYSHYGEGFFSPQWHGGPFGLAVSTLKVDDEGRLVVGLRGEGRGLPNLGRRSEAVRLRITDVVGHQGQSLLPTQACGPDRARDWRSFGAVSEGMQFVDGESRRYPTTSLQTSLELAPGALARDVAAIRGEIEYRLPTRVQRTRVEQPLAGKAVETPHVRVHFQAGSPHSLAYQVSGETHRLVAVRGLNAAGQVLSTGGAVWGDNMFGGGKHASVDVHGSLAAAEVVLAEALDPLRYEFELPHAYPTIKVEEAPTEEHSAPITLPQLTAGLNLPPPQVTFPYDKPLRTVAAGPGLLSLQRLQASSFMGLVTQLNLYLPEQLPMLRQLNAGSIVLERALLPDGTQAALDIAAPVTFSRDGGYYMNGVYQPDPERPWLKGQVSLQDDDYEGADPVSLEGRVVLRAVGGTSTVDLSTDPGARWLKDGLDVKVSAWEENALALEIAQGAERIVEVTATAGGEPVGRAKTLESGRGTTRARIDLHGWPDAVRVTVASEMIEREFPFRLQLGE